MINIQKCFILLVQIDSRWREKIHLTLVKGICDDLLSYKFEKL